MVFVSSINRKRFISIRFNRAIWPRVYDIMRNEEYGKPRENKWDQMNIDGFDVECNNKTIRNREVNSRSFCSERIINRHTHQHKLQIVFRANHQRHWWMQNAWCAGRCCCLLLLCTYLWNWFYDPTHVMISNKIRNVKCFLWLLTIIIMIMAGLVRFSMLLAISSHCYFVHSALIHLP